jgi:putative Mn2+ efflux pump MntP
MTLIKTLLTIVVLAVFSISFMSFDLASLNVGQQASNMLREYPVAVGIFGGIVLIALVTDLMVGPKHVS